MHYLAWLLLGLIGATVFLLLARTRNPDAEPRTIATGLIIAALIYVGFGLIWGDAYWLGIETAGVLLYGLFAFLALRHSVLWLAVGWFLHVGWDVFLHLLGPGHHIAPEWYAYACISFDVLVAGYVVYQFRVSRFGFRVVDTALQD